MKLISCRSNLGKNSMIPSKATMVSKLRRKKTLTLFRNCSVAAVFKYTCECTHPDFGDGLFWRIFCLETQTASLLLSHFSFRRGYRYLIELVISRPAPILAIWRKFVPKVRHCWKGSCKTADLFSTKRPHPDHDRFCLSDIWQCGLYFF